MHHRYRFAETYSPGVSSVRDNWWYLKLSSFSHYVPISLKSYHNKELNKLQRLTASSQLAVLSFWVVSSFLLLLQLPSHFLSTALTIYRARDCEGGCHLRHPRTCWTGVKPERPWTLEPERFSGGSVPHVFGPYVCLWRRPPSGAHQLSHRCHCLHFFSHVCRWRQFPSFVEIDKIRWSISRAPELCNTQVPCGHFSSHCHSGVTVTQLVRPVSFLLTGPSV